VGVGAAALALTKRVAESAEALELASAQSGMTAERLQEVAAVAKQVSGASFDTVSDGLKELALRSAEAAEGTGEAREAFERLGISQAEIARSSPAEVFARVQKEMKGLTAAQRILTAEQVFGGEAGEKFVEVMNLSAGEMERAAKQARALGLVLSSEQVAALDDVQEGFRGLSAQVRGAGRQLAASLAPVLSDVVLPALRGVAGVVAQAAKAFASLSTRTKLIVAGMGAVAAAVGPVIVVVGALGTALTGTAAAVAGAVAAVGALAASASIVYDNWSTIAPALGRMVTPLARR
jgi:hypothetical protein